MRIYKQSEEHRRHISEAKRRGKPRKCKICGNEYYRPPSQIKWRGSSYCSYPCAYKGLKNTRKGKIRTKTKDGIWGFRRADRVFSNFIRIRDNWTCRYCGKNFPDRGAGLHNSHFWGRSRWSTRFDSNNCIALCYSCHIWKFEKEKQGAYKDLMLNWLGEDGYELLRKKAESFKSKLDSIAEFMKWVEPKLKDSDLL